MSKIEIEEIRPFGPMIGKFSLDDDVVESLNKTCDLILENNLEKALDNSQTLAGKVRQEIKIPVEILQAHGQYFSDMFVKYVKSVNKHGKEMPGEQANDIFKGREYNLGSNIKSGWFVRSFAGDYNPAHMHPNCMMSCAGFLKVPDWEEELAADADDHYGLTHGCLSFLFGDVAALSITNHTVRPRVGDIYIFPGWLRHVVYPFRSSGERRSFSLNVDAAVLKDKTDSNN